MAVFGDQVLFYGVCKCTQVLVLRVYVSNRRM